MANWCGHLPLALRIVGALLAEDPARSLAAMAADLSNEQTRLEELQYADSNVGAALDLSYRNLTPDLARAFRLLSLNPGPDVSTETVAVITKQTHIAARRALEALARAHLVGRGSAYGRWRLHDLLRLYADKRGAESAITDQRNNVLERLLQHYLATAVEADAHILASDKPSTGRFIGRADALAWLTSERANLVAAVDAATNLNPRISVGLSLHLATFQIIQRHFDELIGTCSVALPLAHLIGDTHDEGRLMTNLGVALRKVRRLNDACETLKTCSRNPARKSRSVC